MNAVDISSLDDSGKLALARQLHSNIASSMLRELYVGTLSTKSKIPFKVYSYREVLMHRTADLADAALEQYESGRLVPAFISTRAVVETVSFVYWLHLKCNKFLKDADETDLDTFLKRGILGSREANAKHEALNVLSAVDRLDKEFAGFRNMYNTLCEFAHPNWSGTLGAYGFVDESRHTLVLGKEHRTPPLAFGLGPLLASLVIFQDYYNALMPLIEQVNSRYASENKT